MEVSRRKAKRRRRRTDRLHYSFRSGGFGLSTHSQERSSALAAAIQEMKEEETELDSCITEMQTKLKRMAETNEK